MTTGPQHPQERPQGAVPPTQQQVERDPYRQPGAVPGGDDRAMTVLAHLSAPIAAVISLGWLSVLGPLLIWLVYKDRSPLVRQAAAGAFNFNLSFWLLYLFSWMLILTVVGAIVGIPLLVVIFVVSAVMHLVGAARGSKGELFRYPFQLPVLR